MSQEKDYYNFLKLFFTEGIYLVDESNDRNTSSSTYDEDIETKENSVSREPVTDDKNEGGKYEPAFAIILSENLTDELSHRFQKMIDNLNLSLDDILLIQSSDLKDENGLTSLKTTGIIFFGEQKIIKVNTNNAFKPIEYQGKTLLILPSFQDIVRDKDMVLKSWNALKEFTSQKAHDKDQ